MGATQIHLKEMGWKAPWSKGSLLLKDNEGAVWKSYPEYGIGMIRHMLEEDRIKRFWAQASLHRH
eukprot:1038524-Karenia_brevis.AAC.1